LGGLNCDIEYKFLRFNWKVNIDFLLHVFQGNCKATSLREGGAMIVARESAKCSRRQAFLGSLEYSKIIIAIE